MTHLTTPTLTHYRGVLGLTRPVPAPLRRWLEEAGEVCAFCGEPTGPHRGVVFRDGNARNRDAHNLALACALCRLAAHPVAAGVMGLARLAWLPELQQWQINLLARRAWLDADHPQPGRRRLAEELSARLERGVARLALRYGEAAVYPAIFADLAAAESEAACDEIERALDGLRLVPLASAFRREIEDWRRLEAGRA